MSKIEALELENNATTVKLVALVIDFITYLYKNFHDFSEIRPQFVNVS